MIFLRNSTSPADRTAAAEAGQVFCPVAFPGLELHLQALLDEQGALA